MWSSDITFLSRLNSFGKKNKTKKQLMFVFSSGESVHLKYFSRCTSVLTSDFILDFF